ncbi:MAG TPA: PxKF domain-containing protein [Candidatus Limnocylindria bacterium]|nr:PxKF domain-containing protein [Candidatus Limnocylindria bacterium]
MGSTIRGQLNSVSASRPDGLPALISFDLSRPARTPNRVMAPGGTYMRARTGRYLAAIQALLLLASLVVPALAAATEIQTDLWVYQDGDTVTVTGIDFGANEVVDFLTTDPNGVVVDTGSASSDGSGGVVYAFVLHATVEGIYDVVATGATSGLTATTQFDPAIITYTDLGASAVVRQNGQAITFAGTFTCQNDTPSPRCASVSSITIGIYKTNSGNNVDTSVSNRVTSFSASTPAAFPVAATAAATAVNWSVTKTIGTTLLLADGRYEVGVTMAFIDNGGSVQTAGPATNIGAPDEFVVDNTAAGAPAAPTLVGSAPASPSSNSGPSITGSTAEAGLIVRLYKQNDCSGPLQGTGSTGSGTTFSIPVSVGNNSATTFYGTATDASNNVSTCSATSVTYVSDTNAPTAAITANPTNPTTSSSASFAFTSADAGANASGVTRTECQLDGAGFTTCTSPKAYSALSSASHTFQVRAVDNAGNVGSPASFTWVVSPSDTTPPETTVDSSPNNPSNTGTANFNFSGTDSGSGVAGFECQLDGQGFAACLSPTGYNDLIDGSHTFEVRAKDAAGNADASPATFTWTVDTIRPNTTIDSKPSNPSNTGFATFGFSGTDAGSGVAGFECRLDAEEFAPCTSPKAYSDLAGGSHTFQVLAIDAAGNADATPASFTWVIDTVAPVISYAATKAGGAAYDLDTWTNLSVTVAFTCADDSGNLSVNSVVTAGGTVNGDTATGSFTALGTNCVDAAGNAAETVTVNPIKVDKTAPSLSGAPTTSANANGWYKTNVTVAWTCTDGLSTVDPLTDPADTVLSTEGASQTAGPVSCSDLAGNSSSTSVTGISIDQTAPTVALVGGPQHQVVYQLGSVPSAPTCNASDALSDLQAPCTVSGYATTLGTHTVTATATDKAGNVAIDSRTYIVRWTVTGFYSPVDMNRVVNVAKGGSTVPLKFEVFAGSTELTSTADIGAEFTTRKVSCVDFGAVPQDEIEFTTTGGTTFRYDSTGGQFIQNWLTPKAPNCYVVTVTLDDGSALSASFRVK